MFYSFSIILFRIIIFHQFLIPFSNAIPLVENKMLVSIVKGYQNTVISEYSIQKYEAYLGIVYFMIKNWNCDKIADKFEEHERTECQNYRIFLDILYEYLYREYVGIATVKPKFVFQKEIEIEGPIIYAVYCLLQILQFYFKEKSSKDCEYKLNKLFTYYFEPKLLNEKRLNSKTKLENEPKSPINEMILQLAIGTANEWETNENLYGIMRPNFDENLEEMFKKADERAKKDNPSKVNKINVYKHYIIIYSKFDDQRKWTEDALFSEFVKCLATNSEKFLRMAKEYSNYLSRKKEKGNIDGPYDDILMISFGFSWFKLKNQTEFNNFEIFS